MSKKSDHSYQSEVDTQPSRVKKKQQKHLAIAVISIALIGWVFYLFLSSHADLHHRVNENPPHSFRLTIPRRILMVQAFGWNVPEPN